MGLTAGKDFGGGKVFFVMGVIIEFLGTEGVGMESHRVDFTGICLDGEDGTQSIIGSIGFYNDRFIGDPVGQDRCRGESRFQGLEGFPGSIGKVPQNTLVGQPGKRNHNVRIIGNEAAVGCNMGHTVVFFSHTAPVTTPYPWVW